VESFEQRLDVDRCAEDGELRYGEIQVHVRR
jgi:hypothetical protein